MPLYKSWMNSKKDFGSLGRNSPMPRQKIHLLIKTCSFSLRASHFQLPILAIPGEKPIVDMHFTLLGEELTFSL